MRLSRLMRLSGKAVRNATSKAVNDAVGKAVSDALRGSAVAT